MIGNIVFVIIFLVFLEVALIEWGRTFLSGLLSALFNFLPRILTALTILGIGWLIASWVRKALETALSQENVPRVSWIAEYVKILLLTLFSAMAVTELNFAREIVIIAFAAVFVTLCIIAIIIVFAMKDEFVRIPKGKEKDKWPD